MRNLTTQHEPVADVTLLNEDQAAEYYGVSVRTLQRWRQDGNGPRYSKLGHHIRYRRSWLDAHIEAQARTSTSTAA